MPEENTENQATIEPRSSNIVTSYKQIGRVRYVMVTLPIEKEDMDASVLDLEGPQVESAGEFITYRVRGMTRAETLKLQKMLRLVERPEPPMKERPVLPLDTARLSAADIRSEKYADYEDPTYLEQDAIYQREMEFAVQRSTVYNLVVCVQGFDLSDEDITEVLDEEAHPRDPLESYLKRLDQISRIILPTMDQRHYMALQRKIAELSGVRQEDINFM